MSQGVGEKVYGLKKIVDLPAFMASDLKIGDHIMKGSGKYTITEISPKYDGKPLFIVPGEAFIGNMSYVIPKSVRNIEKMERNYCGLCLNGCMYSDTYEDFKMGDLLVHCREDVTWDIVMTSDKYDGIIVRVLGVEYKIKKKFTMDLLSSRLGLLDGNGDVIFNQVLLKSLGKIVEVSKTGIPIRIRDDREKPNVIVRGVYVEMTKFLPVPLRFSAYKKNPDVMWAGCCGGQGAGFHNLKCGKLPKLSYEPNVECSIEYKGCWVSSIPCIKRSIDCVLIEPETNHFLEGRYHQVGYKPVSSQFLEFLLRYVPLVRGNLAIRFAGIGVYSKLFPYAFQYDPRKMYVDLGQKFNRADIILKKMSLEMLLHPIEFWDCPAGFDYGDYLEHYGAHPIFVRAPYNSLFTNLQFGSDNIVVSNYFRSGDKKIGALLKDVVGVFKRNEDKLMPKIELSTRVSKEKLESIVMYAHEKYISAAFTRKEVMDEQFFFLKNETILCSSWTMDSILEVVIEPHSVRMISSSELMNTTILPDRGKRPMK